MPRFEQKAGPLLPNNYYYGRMRAFTQKAKSYRSYPLKKLIRYEAKSQILRSLESKPYDGASSAGEVVDATGEIYNLLTDPSAGTAISQGVGDTQYVGTAITPTHLTVKFIFEIADTTNLCRVIIFQAKSTSVPAAADVLQSASNVRTPLSAFDIDFNDTYRVLADKTVRVDSDGPKSAFKKIVIPMKQMRKVHFSDNAGTIETCGLYMYFVTDSTTANHPPFRAYWRVYFKDA